MVMIMMMRIIMASKRQSNIDGEDDRSDNKYVIKFSIMIIEY